MVFQAGLTIGKYELGTKLGEGGFGFVFVARDTGLDRDIAMKFLHPEHTANPQILQRFLQEARTAAKIVHPGIVTVHECGQVTGTGTPADGTAYIAMELLHGESLSARIARGRMQPLGAMEICRQVASALEAAHRAGIIHRDLKPDNIFLVADPAMPGGERVKVLDFGIAKLAQQATPSKVQTHSMMVFGTPLYMSPEQCKSAAHIDHRSDIYTLGCILFELVCGRAPFDGEAGELIAKHQLVPPPSPRSFAPAVPDALEQLLGDMLAKEPGKRPQTMAAVQRACEAGGGLSGVAPTMLPNESLPRFTPLPFAVPSPTTLSSATGSTSPPRARSHKLVYLIAGFAVAAAAVLMAVVVTRPKDEQPARAPEPAPVGDGKLRIEMPDDISGELFVDGINVATVKNADEVVAHAGARKVKILGPNGAHCERELVVVSHETVKLTCEIRPPEVPVDAAVAIAPPVDAAVPVKPTPPKVVVLTAAMVAAKVQAHAGEIRRCYEAYTKSHTSQGGKLEVAVHVDGGRATGVATGIAAEVDACVAGVVKGLSFPRPTDRNTVDASVSFTLPPTATKQPCTPIKDHVVDPFEKNPCPS